MRARATAGDNDYYRVTVAGDPQLWQIDVAGSAIDLLSWVQADGTGLATGTVSEDRTSAAITDMYLEPGEHWFRIAGSGGEYTLHLTPLGPPDPAAEREPNDDEAHAEVMPVGGERSGRIPLAGDADIYRFSLAAAEHVLIGVEPPPDGAAAFRLSNGSTTLVEQRVPQTGEAIAYDAALPPGDYVIALRTGVASSERYHLSIDRLDPFELRADQEPNDVPTMAPAFPGSLEVDGTGRSDGDYDWYRLPAVPAGDALTVRYGGAVSSVHLSDGAADIAATDDPESGTLTSDPLASDAPVFLSVVAAGDYHLQLSSPALVAVPPPGELPVTLSVVPDTAAVSAYEEFGQRVPAIDRDRERGRGSAGPGARRPHQPLRLDGGARPCGRERRRRGQCPGPRDDRGGAGRVGGHPRPHHRPRPRRCRRAGDRIGRRDARSGRAGRGRGAGLARPRRAPRRTGRGLHRRRRDAGRGRRRGAGGPSARRRGSYRHGLQR